MKLGKILYAFGAALAALATFAPCRRWRGEGTTFGGARRRLRDVAQGRELMAMVVAFCVAVGSNTIPDSGALSDQLLQVPGDVVLALEGSRVNPDLLT